MSAPVPRMIVLFTLVLLLPGCIWEFLLGEDVEDGRITVRLTDAPVDNVQQVRLTIDVLEMVSENGETERFELPGGFTVEDLLQLQGGSTRTVLDNREMAPGIYDEVLVYMEGGNGDSLVRESSGGEFDLFAPGQAPSSGGGQEPIRVPGRFEVEEGAGTRIVLDVDLRRGLWKIPAGNHYILIPALRLVDADEAGGVRGEVNPALLQQSSCTNDLNNDRGHAVYVYSGADAVTGDIHLDQSGQPLSLNNPVTAVPVRQDPDAGVYRYRANHLAEGDYTLALTCQALNDDPALQDGISFVAAENRGVEPGSSVTLDF